MCQGLITRWWLSLLSNLMEPYYKVVLTTVVTVHTIKWRHKYKKQTNPDHLHYPQQLSPLSSELPQSQGWSCSQTWPQRPRQVMNRTQGKVYNQSLYLMGCINSDTQSRRMFFCTCIVIRYCGDVMHQPVQKLPSSHYPLRELSQGANFVAEKRDVCNLNWAILLCMSLFFFVFVFVFVCVCVCVCAKSMVYFMLTCPLWWPNLSCAV